MRTIGRSLVLGIWMAAAEPALATPVSAALDRLRNAKATQAALDALDRYLPR